MEITPEMVEAGERVLETVIGFENLFGKVNSATLVVEVYSAMVCALPSR